jgi:hypothetical protein
MDKRITSLYVIISDNKVVAFGNLQDTVEGFQAVNPEARNYMFYYREFKKAASFTLGEYHFQRLI